MIDALLYITYAHTRISMGLIVWKRVGLKRTDEERERKHLQEKRAWADSWPMHIRPDVYLRGGGRSVDRCL